MASTLSPLQVPKISSVANSLAIDKWWHHSVLGKTLNCRSNKRPSASVLILCVICILSLLPAASAAAAAGPNTLDSRYLLASRQSQQSSPPTNSTNSTSAANNKTCGFDGNQDTYGYGIRIGVYLQWVTSSIAYNFVPEEAILMRGVNNCFQAAMFSGLMFLTIKKLNELHAVEAFILLLFCLGGVCSGNLYVTDQKTGVQKAVPKGYAHLQATTVGGFVRLFLGVAFCVYGVWFSFHGMDIMIPNTCGSYAFFLAKVNLYNWYRTFLKVMFVLGAVPCGILTVLGIYRMIHELNRFLRGGWRKYKTEKIDENSDFERCNPKNLGLGVGLIIFIIAVELTIKWNNIRGVNDIGSTGQLLPLMVSILGVFRVLHRFMVNGLAALA